MAQSTQPWFPSTQPPPDHPWWREHYQPIAPVLDNDNEAKDTCSYCDEEGHIGADCMKRYAQPVYDIRDIPVDMLVFNEFDSYPYHSQPPADHPFYLKHMSDPPEVKMRRKEIHWAFVAAYYTTIMPLCKQQFDHDLAEGRLGRWHKDDCWRFVFFGLFCFCLQT